MNISGINESWAPFFGLVVDYGNLFGTLVKRPASRCVRSPSHQKNQMQLPARAYLTTRDDSTGRDLARTAAFDCAEAAVLTGVLGDV